MASGGFATYLTNQAIPELFIHSTIHLTYSMTTNIIYHYELLTLPNYVYSLDLTKTSHTCMAKPLSACPSSTD